ncbi:NADH-quinone oxidoreductase subunit N [Mucilaginibacter sp. BJC16-A38]|uniref:NADH-quinone oxidoreductase subunit N n=1 Tax=Mucilaginibacter phenanthrenivorans TaxID=1234842 RepID=UPI0021571528|nr:NADH-quinone oxidoreductase subunit N [Mucilaginibacter phenanthrenivorans]MCR8558501.1 NADH-quinone oxidoreductase subunit N [Mucilaginibacter phenanthrenivorans]MDP9078128.1 NADH-quinone oxidoreductase subunit N [Bacteroidota bacterium]
MNTLIIISVLPLVLLYLGLYKAQKALLPVTIIGLLLALGCAISQWNDNAVPIYHGMMLFDNFSIMFSGITIVSTILIIFLSRGYFERISNHIAEYYAIILFSLAGIIVMVSFHNLTMLFIGIEIMSVSLYILAGIKKSDFASNEAALKYFLMGAFSTGFLLFGIALIYGSSGSFNLEAISSWVLDHPHVKDITPMFYTGVLLIIVGLCFKVGAAPFHFWTPDVYEGSPTLITAFMSTVVKTAGFAAFLRLFSACFAPLSAFWVPVLLVITVITLFIGNITALYQHSFKRMLAFSSISHAGYLLFAIVALGASSGSSVAVYATAYSIASIIAFGALILVQQQSGSDNFESFNGLSKKNPFLALVVTIAMLSLAGIPLTAGFIGKFFMFSTALKQYQVWLVVLAVVNAIISIFYYFRVIVAMYFRDAERAELTIPVYYKFVLGLSALITILIGVYPDVISKFF